MKLYKITYQNSRTRVGFDNETLWEEGTTVEKPGPRYELCTDTVIHAYKDPNLALLLNPIHTDVRNPQLWECDGEIAVEDRDKVGCSKLTTIHKMDLPEWYTGEHQGAAIAWFAVLCAELVVGYYKLQYPEDNSLERALNTVKEYLKGKSDKQLITPKLVEISNEVRHSFYRAKDDINIVAGGVANAVTYLVNAFFAIPFFDFTFDYYMAKSVSLSVDCPYVAESEIKIDLPELAKQAIKLATNSNGE